MRNAPRLPHSPYSPKNLANWRFWTGVDSGRLRSRLAGKYRLRVRGDDAVRRRAVLEARAGADGAADAERLRVAGDLVGEDLHVAQDAIDARHHAVQAARRLAQVVEKGWVVQQALE